MQGTCDTTANALGPPTSKKDTSQPSIYVNIVVKHLLFFTNLKQNQICYKFDLFDLDVNAIHLILIFKSSLF